MSEEQTRALRLEYSRYFVFGGEESYGYLAQDFVRDKDANSAAIILRNWPLMRKASARAFWNCCMNFLSSSVCIWKWENHW